MPDLYCAVPEHKPVPPFVQDPTWEFAGTTTPDAPRPPGFDETVARFASQFQGFYTFRTDASAARSRRLSL
jgi:hypothetical protein